MFVCVVSTLNVLSVCVRSFCSTHLQIVILAMSMAVCVMELIITVAVHMRECVLNILYMLFIVAVERVRILIWSSLVLCVFVPVFFLSAESLRMNHDQKLTQCTECDKKRKKELCNAGSTNFSTRHNYNYTCF